MFASLCMFLSIFFSTSHFPPRILAFIICISTRLDRVRVILIKDADDERSEMQRVKTICNLEFFRISSFHCGILAFIYIFPVDLIIDMLALFSQFRLDSIP